MSRAPDDAAEIAQAKRNAMIARARVQTTAGALKERLSPSNLAAEAKEKVRETTSAIGGKASSAVQKRPVAASVAAGIAALVLLRKPIRGIGRFLFRRKKKHEEEPQRDAGPQSEELMRAGEPPKPSVTPRMERAVTRSNAAALNKE